MTTDSETQSTRASVPLVDIKALQARIAGLRELDDDRKQYLQDRWLHMVRWWDQRSRESRWKYFALRSIVLVGGVLTPALVSLQTSTLVVGHKEAIQLMAIVVGLLIATAAGLEEIFHFGDIWREKRNSAELIKIEGWRYLQLIGPYHKEDHAAAYPDFAANVELMIEHEIKDYLVVAKPEEKGEIQKLIDERIADHLKRK